MEEQVKFVVGQYYSVNGWPKKLIGMNTTQDPPHPIFATGEWYHPDRIGSRLLTDLEIVRHCENVVGSGSVALVKQLIEKATDECLADHYRAALDNCLKRWQKNLDDAITVLRQAQKNGAVSVLLTDEEIQVVLDQLVQAKLLRDQVSYLRHEAVSYGADENDLAEVLDQMR